MSGKQSTVATGNEFRDYVAGLLVSAGFQKVETEVKLDGDKLDVVAHWQRDEIDGERRYSIEAKNYGGTLPIVECNHFIHAHSKLISKNLVDRGWLISKGQISPDGRKNIEDEANLKCFTIDEFRRQILSVDRYLKDIIREDNNKNISDYYIQPHTENNVNLEGLVRDWVDEDGVEPLAIIGGYGIGKSTFALHFAAKLATEALTDKTRRIPVLIPLGEISDEQSIDGLVGKIMASRHRVSGYHFDLFKNLNDNGLFILIFDGFDEMKHGMTLRIFERNIGEILKLDGEKSKIIVLGRDTAFHDDYEFQFIIKGIQRTPGGSELNIPGRRSFRDVKIRSFSSEEAKLYIRKYLPSLISREQKQATANEVKALTEARVKFLEENYIDDILKRPVHAQMLCEIAAQKEIPAKNISKFHLYDMFLQLLVDREFKKKGRSELFTPDIRRKFNASLSWWLWIEGRSSTTTITDIPNSLFQELTSGMNHDFDQDGLKRELIAGCLVEKAAKTIYFGHRSIQEFLVSEFLFLENLLAMNDRRRSPLDLIVSMLNAEIIEFLLGWIENAKDPSAIVIGYLENLSHFSHPQMPLKGFEVYSRLIERYSIKDQISWIRPWGVFINYFRANKAANFQQGTTEATAYLAMCLGLLRKNPTTDSAVFLQLASRVLAAQAERSVQLLPGIIAAWLPTSSVKIAMDEAQKRTGARFSIQKDKLFLLWLFLKTTRIERDGANQLQIYIDLDNLEACLHDETGIGFANDREYEATKLGGHLQVRCLAQSVLTAMVTQGSTTTEIELMRRFFSAEDVRRRMSALEVVVKRSPPSREVSA